MTLQAHNTSEDLYLSFSRIYRGMLCPWDYATYYIDNTAPKLLPLPMQFGTLGHRALQLGLLSNICPGDDKGSPILKTLIAEQDERIETLNIDPATVVMADPREAIDVARRGWKAIGIGDRYVTWQTPDKQQAIELEVTSDKFGRVGAFHGTKGKIDWVCVDRKNGDVIPVDFKFTGRFAPLDEGDFALQFAIYQLLLKYRYGLEPRKSGRYQIRSALPKIPQLLKSGKSVSKDKSIATDWTTYSQAIEDNGFDESDYEEMRIVLQSEDRMQRFDLSYRSEVELNNIEMEINRIAASLSRLHDGTSERPRHINSRNCRGCPMQMLCRADLCGHDAVHVRETFYTDRMSPLYAEASQSVAMLDDGDDLGGYDNGRE